MWIADCSVIISNLLIFNKLEMIIPQSAIHILKSNETRIIHHSSLPLYENH